MNTRGSGEKIVHVNKISEQVILKGVKPPPKKQVDVLCHCPQKCDTRVPKDVREWFFTQFQSVDDRTRQNAWLQSQIEMRSIYKRLWNPEENGGGKLQRRVSCKYRVPTNIPLRLFPTMSSNEVRKLTLMYLANDVIQNSRRKGPEFGKEFSSVLRRAFTIIGGNKLCENTVKKLQRLLNVWQERNIYDGNAIEDFRICLFGKEPESPESESPPEKKAKWSLGGGEKASSGDKSRRISQIEVDGAKEVHVTLSPYSPPRDPPEAEELIKALMDLENAASVDAAVREKISKLPPEVSEVKLLDKIDNKEAAVELAERVNAAVDLLQNYNTRLAQEMEDRKRVMQMLKDFTVSQKELMAQAQQRIEEYREKLTKVELVKHEVCSHINNLPKLQQLPDVTGGLAPLPSAGDLFT